VRGFGVFPVGLGRFVDRLGRFVDRLGRFVDGGLGRVRRGAFDGYVDRHGRG
jgi:hypothetical protein